MNNQATKDRLREAYAARYLDHSVVKTHHDLTSEGDKVVSVFYDELPYTEVEGYPVASELVDSEGKTYSYQAYKELSKEKQESCRLRYLYLPPDHELCVGTTGSGKTTGRIEPQLRAMMTQKNKPNLFVSDPKGELFDRNAGELRNQGYRIFVLNFKDTSRSDRWNPFGELYDRNSEFDTLRTGGTLCLGKPKETLMRMAPKEAFDGEFYYAYRGMAFPNEESMLAYWEKEECELDAEIDSMVNQLAHMFIHAESRTDRSWEYGAMDLLKGLIYCLLEDQHDKTKNLTRDRFTLRTVHELYVRLRKDIVAGSATLDSHLITKTKSRRTLSLMRTAMDNAGNTMRSYCGVFDGCMKDWFMSHIFSLTTGDTIDLNSNDDTPYAIFNITRDYEKSDFVVAGLFVDWVYRTAVKKAEASPNSRLPRALHFLLDEFGNIPEISDFENKVSTARSRNIWFHLVVQSYKQIEIVYDVSKAGRAVVIRDNCNTQVFLGAQNRETKEIFSRECGNQQIPTYASYLDESVNELTAAPCVPVSALDLIEPGEMYIKRVFQPVFTSRFLRSYEAVELGIYQNNCGGLKNELPYNFEAFNSAKYSYFGK